MARTVGLTMSTVLALAVACGGNGTTIESTPTGAGGDGGSAGAGGGAGGASGSGGGLMAGSGGSGGSGGTALACDGKDSDQDTIADSLEGGGAVDTDKDGKPDSMDADSDNDGVPDAIEAAACGQTRTDVCQAPVDSDDDGVPDYRDLDSDNDGVPDADEKLFDPNGAKCCRTKADCDGDGVVDVVEVAAGSNPTDPGSVPSDATLYFVLPFQGSEKLKDFPFSTGIKQADVFFLVDTTNTMQLAITNLTAELDKTIIPTILNGDAKATPPIPAIPGAHIGIGEFRDVPWMPNGEKGDELFRISYPSGNGQMAPPQGAAPNLTAPASVKSILGTLKAGGGGDSPEGTSQALWMLATGKPYFAAVLDGTGMSSWKFDAVNCPAGRYGAACFRPDAISVAVVLTDAPFHNGPIKAYDYPAPGSGATVPYSETVKALKARGTKVVGVTFNTGTPGAARADLNDLATQTGSVYLDGFGAEKPLVTTDDVMTTVASSQIVRMIGLLAGQGINTVTTVRTSYDCVGGIDCTGDGVSDPEFHNPAYPPGSTPIDAAQFITAVEPLESMASPLPYATKDATTFYGVSGDKTVSFRVHAQNKTLNPPTLLVLRAVIQVQTPLGQKLGGPLGTKQVYFVIPRDASVVK